MLYIRHGEKAYSNGNSEKFPLDPPLTEKGKIDAKEKFTQLLLAYGHPEVIICSPFLRTRETAEIAVEVIYNNNNVLVPMIFSNNIGEYLGNQTKILPQFLKEETLNYNPILMESWQQFIERTKPHNIPNICKAWYISHGLTIQHIIKHHKQHLNDVTKTSYPKVLEGFAIIDNIVTTI